MSHFLRYALDNWSFYVAPNPRHSFPELIHARLKRSRYFIQAESVQSSMKFSILDFMVSPNRKKLHYLALSSYWYPYSTIVH